MHEVGIAQSILEIVENETTKNNASSVKCVKLIVGEFTGVVKEALEFALDIIKQNTIAKNAEFIIEKVRLKTYCQDCDKTFVGKRDANFFCPNCNNILNIVEGKELQIDFIDVE